MRPRIGDDSRRIESKYEEEYSVPVRLLPTPGWYNEEQQYTYITYMGVRSTPGVVALKLSLQRSTLGDPSQ